MSYTNVNKPTGTSYVNINSAKPSYDELSISYDDPLNFYDGFNPNLYTKLSKPSGTAYTNIAKPT